MIRLVFTDLRDNIAIWVGAFVVAAGCGYVGGWVVSLQATAAFCGEAMQGFLQTVGSSVLVFSLIAAVAVLASTAGLTVSAQRRSYALWQLAYVRPRAVGMVVLVQLAIVAIMGALCGTVLAAGTFAPLFPWLFIAREEVAQVVPHVDMYRMPAVWLAVAGVFLCGGLKGARSAGKTPPLAVLREPEPKRVRMTWLRAVLFVCLAACAGWLHSIMAESSPEYAMTWSIFMPVLVVATLVPFAPVLFSTLLSAWASIVPQKRWNAWYIAWHSARYGLSSSTSTETPIMVGFGLAAGLYSVMNILAAWASGQGIADTSGYTLDVTESLLMLGGPVLLCAIGAAVSVAMASRSRTRDIALFVANGAQPQTILAAATCEAFIHATTATLVGMIGVLVSNALVAHALGLSMFGHASFGAGLVVSFAGFILVLAATLIPTFSALGKEAAIVLTVQV